MFQRINKIHYCAIAIATYINKRHATKTYFARSFSCLYFHIQSSFLNSYSVLFMFLVHSPCSWVSYHIFFFSFVALVQQREDFLRLLQILTMKLAILSIQFLERIMKKGAVSLIKQIGTVVAAMVLKAKPRAMLLRLLPSKKLLTSAISGRIPGKAAALRSSARHVDLPVEYDGDSEEDEYLSHCLFDSDDAGDGKEGWSDGHDACSAINLVRSSREDGGVEFILEEEIDDVADVFIRRVHSQMMLQN